MRKIFVLQDKDTQSDSISTWARELATAFKHETDSISADKNTSADDFAKHLEDEDASLLIIELTDKKHIQQYLNLCRGLRVPYLFIRPQQAFRIDKISLPITFETVMFLIPRFNPFSSFARCINLDKFS